MNPKDNLGFVLSSREIDGNVLIPRYYDPKLRDELLGLRKSHDLLVLGEMIDRHEIEVSSGDEIGKMAYGTGNIPFVRTSDISNWELRADPKQGVSTDIYGRYSKRQDVRPDDLLFVRDGTYLIGQSCIVTEFDRQFLYQSHVLKFRVARTSPIGAPLLLAALSEPIVRRQIRNKQFTADIIDTIGNRFRELVLPIPRDAARRRRAESVIRRIIVDRARAKDRLRMLPYEAESAGAAPVLPGRQQGGSTEERASRLGFLLPQSAIRGNVLVPRFYDPIIIATLARLRTSHQQVSIGELVEAHKLVLTTGVEIGKMSYGTGTIPFIRTSDLPNWELSADPKQRVSEEVCRRRGFALDSRPGDILLVRDGTYLIGSNCIITKHDPPFLFASGIYRLRTESPNELDPFLLWTLLNTPIVQQQLRSVQFTRDVIDTIGHRVNEIVLPIPKESTVRRRVIAEAKRNIELRASLRNLAVQTVESLQGSGTRS